VNIGVILADTSTFLSFLGHLQILQLSYFQKTQNYSLLVLLPLLSLAETGIVAANYYYPNNETRIAAQFS
jgi:hypothetical protein